MRDEYTATEWAKRPRPRVRHGCVDPKTCAVFRCRAPRGLPLRVACGKYVGACQGGAEDDRCADCYVKYMKALKRAVLAEVRSAAWRGEVRLCRKFGGGPTHTQTEDALYELLREKKIEWFGPDDRPLRYRVVR